jgi:hypothetical protein
MRYRLSLQVSGTSHGRETASQRTRDGGTSGFGLPGPSERKTTPVSRGLQPRT